MEKGYVITCAAQANGKDLTVRIIGGTVTFTFENQTMPALVAAVIRAQGCIASSDGVEQVIKQTA